MKKFKIRSSIMLLFLCVVLPVQMNFAQNRDLQRINADADAAQQYVVWIRQAITENRMSEAAAAIERALNFSNVDSDVSFLAAFIYSKMGGSRPAIAAHLDTAINVNRWVYYSENEALVLKAEQLVAMRRYPSAITTLEQIREGDVSRDATISLLPLSTDAAMLKLRSFRGIALNTRAPTEIAAFQTLTLSTMNRFSRDPRPVRIFLEYLQSRKIQNTGAGLELSSMDQQVLDLVIRRLPILVEIDPELAWMTAPYMRNMEDARRYTAAYRAGGFSGTSARDFRPSAGSISLALNYGLIDDATAVNELFSGTVGINNVMPLPRSLVQDNPALDFYVINEIYDMLRNETGRDSFSNALFSFVGYIYIDSDNDGIIENIAFFNNGAVRKLNFDKNQESIFDNGYIDFDSNGTPVSAVVPVSLLSTARVSWERYPFVKQIVIADETFNFRPADFNYAPIAFLNLGGSRTRTGISYPVLSHQLDLVRRTLVMFSAGIDRPSAEFKGAIERIFLENGIPRQAVEILNNNIVSITEFERGAPVIQYADLDLDGRMETIRRFHRPGQNYDPEGRFDYRRLIASSESDWTGEGRFKTGEVYLQDGSVVYQWDMDGTGTMNYSEGSR